MSNNVIKRVLSLMRITASDQVQSYKLTVPKDFIDILGWEKGDKIDATLIVGSGMVCLEKQKNE